MWLLHEEPAWTCDPSPNLLGTKLYLSVRTEWLLGPEGTPGAQDSPSLPRLHIPVGPSGSQVPTVPSLGLTLS